MKKTRTRRMILALLLLLPLLILGFVLIDTSDSIAEANMSYAQALADTVHHTRFAPGSREKREALERFGNFYSNLTADSVRGQIGLVFAEKLYFNDTLKTIRQRDSLEAYFVAATRAVNSARVELKDVAVSDDGYYFRWEMEIRFKKLASGRPTRSIGVSHVRFDADGRVILQQDFWDAASGLYEHVPLLGSLMRRIKARF